MKVKNKEISIEILPLDLLTPSFICSCAIAKATKKTKGLQKVNYVCFSFYSFFPDLELGFYCTVYERIGALEHNKLRTSYVLLVYI